MSAHERERLAAWIDGELPADEKAAVDAHLAECEECAALLADMEGVDEVARLVGYADTSSFVRAFKRCKGQPPRRFAQGRT